MYPVPREPTSEIWNEPRLGSQETSGPALALATNVRLLSCMSSSCPLLTGSRYSRGPGAIWCTCLSRTMGYILHMKQGKTVPCKVLNPAQAMWAFHLLVRKWSRPKAHSYLANWRLKNGMLGTAFSIRASMMLDTSSLCLTQPFYRLWASLLFWSPGIPRKTLLTYVQN